ncbi:MAG: valine--tRNA ligase [Anaerolineae bacterium]|nr:valine--tRNA ligase [Anaerolineae bacterium]
MPKAMPKNFDFKEAEQRLYKQWEDGGWFKPEVASPDAEPFVISMPPPNITGSLHAGHAMFCSLEDVMVRYERMRGKAALWVPGTDHASIATQLILERKLKEEGLSRRDIGREKFLERAWAWKAESGGRITEQIRRLGSSCDWSRERFTMDEGLSEAVLDVFVTLHRQGLVYRGPRLVNWSPGLQTAVSDVEVERTEEVGKLYFFRYPVEGGEYIPVATTRPETILGDTAVCVHPEDPRYQHLIGKTAYVPLLNRPIPVIADEYVDREFGTGALKITPAHDFNDWTLGQAHKLAIVNIMNKDATLNENAGAYAGLDRFEARKRVWADMDAAGLTIEVKDHPMIVPRAQRGGEVIEPLLSEQWFVRMQPLAEKAMAAVRDGRIKFVPERFEKVFFHWMENIEDWCISRQLWWGHRIPAWHHPSGEIRVGKAAPEGEGWTADEDVLDTWFSSGLWPFSTLGWPSPTADLGRYYPTHIMETGYDILFFWVARMIMFGLWLTDEAPFHTVYLHGLVRDKSGRKMSKTYGNVIDPVDLMDKYGADPLRFTLLTSSTPGNDINLDESRIESDWKFVNKLWQITNFVTSGLPDDFAPALPPASRLDLPSRWVLSALNKLTANAQRLFDNHQYGEAGRQVRAFLWDEFADWYIEASKYALYGEDAQAKADTQQVLFHVLETCVRLLHPFMPFVTEEIWAYLPARNGLLIVAQWPTSDAAYLDDKAEAEMDVLRELIRGVRNLRLEYTVEPGKKVNAAVAAGSYRESIAAHGFLFSRLCNVAEVTLVEAAPDESASVTVGDVVLYLPLAGLIDYRAEVERLEKEQAALAPRIAKSESMLGNEGFVSRAKPEVVQREREALAEMQASFRKNAERVDELKAKIR